MAVSFDCGKLSPVFGVYEKRLLAEWLIEAIYVDFGGKSGQKRYRVCRADIMRESNRAPPAAAVSVSPYCTRTSASALA